MSAALFPTGSRPRRRFFRRRPPRSLVIGGGMILFWIALAIFGPLVWTADPTALNLGASLLPPSLRHPFGTDNLGRDVLLRIINGASIDLQIGLFTVLPALTIGSLVGALAGYYRSLADMTVMRLVDIVVAFPFFVLVIAIIAVLGFGHVRLSAASKGKADFQAIRLGSAGLRVHGLRGSASYRRGPTSSVSGGGAPSNRRPAHSAINSRRRSR